MDSKISFNFDAIGTKWAIDIYEDFNEGKNLGNEIENIISDFSKIFSRFDPSSKISKAAKSPSVISIPAKYIDLIHLYLKLYKLSKGKFTPLIGNLLEDAGYDKAYSLKPKTLRQVPPLEDIISINDLELNIKKPVMLDFGAAGKGFLVDLISDFFIKKGIRNYCIDAGGDILFKTDKAEFLKVGLENPDNFNQVIGVCNIKNQSICGSAINRRKWNKFNHIFDPDNLSSIENIVAVWVIAETGLIADGLSTTLFLVDPAILKKDFTFEYLIIYKDYQFKKSENFPGEIFFQRREKIQ